MMAIEAACKVRQGVGGEGWDRSASAPVMSYEWADSRLIPVRSERADCARSEQAGGLVGRFIRARDAYELFVTGAEVSASGYPRRRVTAVAGVASRSWRANVIGRGFLPSGRLWRRRQGSRLRGGMDHRQAHPRISGGGGAGGSFADPTLPRSPTILRVATDSSLLFAVFGSVARFSRRVSCVPFHLCACVLYCSLWSTL